MRPFAEMKLADAKDEFERRFIEMKLKEQDYNVSRCAEVLGVYPSNLHGKVKKLGIELKK
jgi:two-component system nitrogen regulation response regulator NtrX